MLLPDVAGRQIARRCASGGTTWRAARVRLTIVRLVISCLAARGETCLWSDKQCQRLTTAIRRSGRETVRTRLRGSDINEHIHQLHQGAA